MCGEKAEKRAHLTELDASRRVAQTVEIWRPHADAHEVGNHQHDGSGYTGFGGQTDLEKDATVNLLSHRSVVLPHSDKNLVTILSARHITSDFPAESREIGGRYIGCPLTKRKEKEGKFFGNIRKTVGVSGNKLLARNTGETYDLRTRSLRGSDK